MGIPRERIVGDVWDVYVWVELFGWVGWDIIVEKIRF
jgi:hypothetical protein